MFLIIKSVYSKNRITVKRAYPKSLIMQRIISGVGAVFFPVLLYVYLFDGRVSKEFYLMTGTNDYISFITLGVAINILSFSTLMNVGRCLITEIREGTLDTFLLSPASRIGYFIGCYVEQFMRSIFEFIAVILFGVILGARFNLNFDFVITTFLASLSFFSVAIFLSTIMVTTRDTYISQNTIFAIMTLICGVLFPIDYLPRYLQLLAQVFPLTHAITLMRNSIILQHDLMSNLDIMANLLYTSIPFLIIGYLAYRRYEKKLVENVFA